MDTELKVSPEIGKPKIAQDTIRLPFEKSEFIHIQAETGRIAQAFSEYASQFGVDRDEAKSFFENKVDFQFGEAGKLHFPGIGRFDQILSDVIGKIQGGTILGIVVPNDERYTLCLDTQAIAQALPNFKTRSFGITDYTNMTLEKRVTGFEQAVKSLTEHEFFHLIQFMKNPQESIKAAKQVLQSMRLLFAYTTTSFSALALFPHDSGTPIVTATPFVIGAIVYLNRGEAKVESDAYDAQKKALQLNLRNPYTFTHETG